jgi:hypothetical protein
VKVETEIKEKVNRIIKIERIELNNTNPKKNLNL